MAFEKLDVPPRRRSMGTEDAKQRCTRSKGDTVDRRRIELQIRAVMVTYRVEQRRRDSPTMTAFRIHARLLLDGLNEAVRPYPDLQARLDQARRELDRT